MNLYQIYRYHGDGRANGFFFLLAANRKAAKRRAAEILAREEEEDGGIYFARVERVDPAKIEYFYGFTFGTEVEP